MKTNKLRVLIPLAILLIAGIGFAAHAEIGTLSAIGWEDISILCPLGALGTMLASKTMVPRALISLAVGVVAIVILGRAFCGWICPVPVWSKLRGLLKRQDDKKDTDGIDAEASDPQPVSATKVEADAAKITEPLSEAEAKALKSSCHTCHAERPADSRHIVLGGALLSAAIFGFPVFCLICPIGLSFAFVFVLILLFGSGDVTWSVVAIPALLLIEVVFFRKWCSHICPLSSLMSLIGKANKTFRPTIDDNACLETSRGVPCGRCNQVCEVAINPRHPELGASWSECTKCRKCVESCPGDAITMPFLAKSKDSNASGKPNMESANVSTSAEVQASSNSTDSIPHAESDQ